MYRALFSVLILAFCCQSCQRFEALNDPDILSALDQNKAIAIGRRQQELYNTVQLQETFILPSNCDTLSLADLFGIALSNNPNVAKTWQDARSAASRYSASLSSYLPDLTFEYSAQAIRADTPFGSVVGSERYWQWGPKLSLDYLIFDFGNRSYNSQSYYQLVQSSNLTHKQMLQSTLQSVATKYYNYLYSKEKLIADKSDLENYEEDYKAAEKKSTLGIVAKSDVLIAKSKYLNAQITVVNQEYLAKNSFLSLVEEIGVSPQNTFEVKGFDKKIKCHTPQPSRQALVEVAKLQRPDYLEKKAIVLSKEAMYKSIQAKHLPQIDVSGMGKLDSYSTGLKNATAYEVKFGLSFPLFTGFLISNDVREAESELKGAVSTLRSVRLKMIQEVYTAYNNIISYEKQLQLTEEYLKASQEEQTIILEKYKKGIVTILDLLQASSSLSNARAQVVKAKRGYFVALIDLSYATGSLTNAKG